MDATPAQDREHDDRPGLRWWVTVAVLLGGLVLAMRSWTFGESVMDFDESVYLLVARGLLDGELPYVDVFDFKPPGIYLIYAGVQLLPGDSVVMLRLSASLAVVITCLLLVALGRVMWRESRIGGVVAGALYAIHTVQSGGLAANTELFYIPFTVAAMIIVFRGALEGPNSGRRMIMMHLLAGLLLGIGIQIKTFVLFDGLAAGLVMMLGAWYAPGRTAGQRLRVIVVLGVALLVGALFWFAPVVLWYRSTGHLHEYYFANFVVTRTYSGQRDLNIGLLLDRLLRGQLVMSPVLWAAPALALLGLLLTRSRERLGLIGALIWALCTAAAIFVTRRYYPHYFLQAYPALCLLGGVLSAAVAGRLAHRAERLLVIGLVLAPPVLAIAIPSAWHSLHRGFLHYVKHQAVDDPIAEVAAYVESRIEGDDVLYVADASPMIYYLSGSRLPTRYAAPLYLVSDDFRAAIEIDLEDEVGRIMSLEPVYVVVRDRWHRPHPSKQRFSDLLGTYIDDDYVLETKIGEVEIFRRAEPPSP